MYYHINLIGQSVIKYFHPRLRAIQLAVFTVISFSGVALTPLTISAQSGQPWSWSSGDPTLVSGSKLDTNFDAPLCSHIEEKKIVSDIIEPVPLCINRGKNLDYGYGRVSWWGFRTYVGFKYDNAMYPVHTGCSVPQFCAYLSSSDTFVIKEKRPPSFVPVLKVYKNFSKRIRRQYVGLSTYYSFDDSDPDLVFPYGTGGIASSPDGRLLVFEAETKAIIIMDGDTLKMRRISNRSFLESAAIDSPTQLAITNDGQHVAVMGSYAARPTMIEVVGDCGDEPTADILLSQTPPLNPCSDRSINFEIVQPFIGYSGYAVRPTLSDDGGELHFYTTLPVPYSHYEVTLRAAGYQSQRMDYLALGDSYSSGEGETDDKYYTQGTNDLYEKCHVSSRSYPFLVAQSAGILPEFVRNIACSGAKIGDVLGDDKSSTGQNDRLGVSGLALTKDYQKLAKDNALYSFIPGRLHQMTFVKHYQPKVVTIGIGGNDTGLMEKLRSCVGAGSCRWANDLQLREKVAIEIKNLYPKLVSLYTAIHAASPASKIYVIGYPKIIDENGECGWGLGSLLDKNERIFMNQSVSYVNQVIQTAAKTVGVPFIDIQNSYDKNVLCGQKTPAAINAIRAGDDDSLFGNDWFRWIGQESFHPNNLGHSKVAAVISATTDKEYCQSSGLTVCPTNTPAPEPSEYWIPEGMHGYPKLHIGEFTSGSDNDNTRSIALNQQSFEPGTNVIVEVNSEPQQLGVFTVENDGSLNIDIQLPDNLDQGYHTLHIYGTSYSGDAIDLYQTIMFAKAIEPAPVNSSIIDNDSKDLQIDTPEPKGNHDTANNSRTDGGVLGDIITRKTLAFMPNDKPSEPLNAKMTNYNAPAIITLLITIIGVSVAVIKSRRNRV